MPLNVFSLGGSDLQIPDDEVTLNGSEDLLLKQHVLLLSFGNNVLLADSFHGVIFTMVHCGHLRKTPTVIICLKRNTGRIV